MNTGPTRLRTSTENVRGAHDMDEEAALDLPRHRAASSSTCGVYPSKPVACGQMCVSSATVTSVGFLAGDPVECPGRRIRNR